MFSFGESKDVALKVAKEFNNVDYVDLYRVNYPPLNKYK